MQDNYSVQIKKYYSCFRSCRLQSVLRVNEAGQLLWIIPQVRMNGMKCSVSVANRRITENCWEEKQRRLCNWLNAREPECYPNKLPCLLPRNFTWTMQTRKGSQAQMRIPMWFCIDTFAGKLFVTSFIRALESDYSLIQDFSKGIMRDRWVHQGFRGFIVIFDGLGMHQYVGYIWVHLWYTRSRIDQTRWIRTSEAFIINQTG